MPSTDPNFSDGDVPFGFGFFNNLNLNINGVSYVDAELLYGPDQFVLPYIPCAGPFNPYDPCFFNIVYTNGALGGLGIPPLLFSGPNSDPYLILALILDSPMEISLIPELQKPSLYLPIPPQFQNLRASSLWQQGY